MANDWKADYLMSIHINAGGGTGYEDFIYSGLSSNSKTARLRNVIHEEIVKATNWTNRGKKKANFHMLRESDMSSMLTENFFIDNKTDAAKLKNANVINDIAQAHAVGLAKAFNLKKKTTSTPKKKTGTIYKVQVGAFKSKANAEAHAKKLEKAGFSTYIVVE